ncbi:glycosyltransferase family 2 protein [Polynucleobacter sp. CS-Odin-A6]|uniref:glycosyltransferase family 2 protein n=1 Tax=Polynucleobacter sp. CS-Odin-A6 TaxID=2689106 RepID=UPI001C0CABB3|nr:glycosyltransferase family 2 protein [Polynucleobacter sp. CS-Odin-A6]MBU3621005.1 glycosyltransferase family 2 protein [Polynucleobacter sp. CS-Odin-A6]
MKISVIVATYNRIDALDFVLQSLETQSDLDFEVLIADDGSKSDTKDFIDSFKLKSSLQIKHIWQEDLGFRLALIRNLASAEASGEYLIFLDGDCIVQPDFVAQHRQLAQKGYFTTGSRALLNEALTKDVLSWPGWDFKKFANHLLSHRLSGGVNKYWPLKIKLGDGSWRNYKQFVWRRIKGCNLACWKADAFAIGGFDDTMTGWGHEDADFVFRLHNSGLIRKSGSWSTEVLHLYHRMNDQSNAVENARRVREKILAKAN